MPTLFSARTKVVGLLLVVCTLIITTPLVAADEEEIAKLKQERVDVLKELVEARSARYAAGDGTVQSLIGAQSDFLEALLEIEQPNERQLVYVRFMLALAKQAEEIAKIRSAQGLSTVEEPLALRANRLKIQIMYLELGGSEEADLEADNELIEKIDDYFGDDK